MFPEIISVGELNRLARARLEDAFPLLWVAGEVSNLVRAASGHVYFTLKDDQAQVRCALFRNAAQRVLWRMENGQQLELRAQVTLYEARGDFQLTVEAVRRAGQGRLYEAFLRLRDRLQREGVFDSAKKRSLPRFPRCLGIVTSPQAAALQDVRAALARRAPHVPVILYPSPVQGTDAPARLVAALRAAAEHGRCDLLLLVRGGGSLEDLWSFNDEYLARNIAASPIPVICGVGHETDLTIADLAADRRAATPTAAAELASAGWFEAAAELAALALRLRTALRRGLQNRMQRLDHLARRLVDPAERLARARHRLTQLSARLAAAAERRRHRQQAELTELRLRLARARPRIDARRTQVERLAAALHALDPRAALARGYALVRADDGQLVRSYRQLRVGAAITLQLADGGGEALVSRIIPDHNDRE